MFVVVDLGFFVRHYFFEVGWCTVSSGPFKSHLCICSPPRIIQLGNLFMHPTIVKAKRSKKENLTWWQAFVKKFWSKGGDKIRRQGGTLCEDRRSKESRISQNKEIENQKKQLLGPSRTYHLAAAPMPPQYLWIIDAMFRLRRFLASVVQSWLRQTN